VVLQAEALVAKLLAKVTNERARRAQKTQKKMDEVARKLSEAVRLRVCRVRMWVLSRPPSTAARRPHRRCERRRERRELPQARQGCLRARVLLVPRRLRQQGVPARVHPEEAAVRAAPPPRDPPRLTLALPSRCATKRMQTCGTVEANVATPVKSCAQRAG
jgi:hypothetical protein